MKYVLMRILMGIIYFSLSVTLDVILKDPVNLPHTALSSVIFVVFYIIVEQILKKIRNRKEKQQ